MTTKEIARLFHARRSGTYKGRYAYQGKCPTHDDRMASLSITEPEPGRSKVHCFAGCYDLDVLASKGLTVGDLYADKRTMTPAIRQELSDRDRLAILERRHGLFIMLQAVEPEKRYYWAAAERNVLVEIRQLRRTLFPVEVYYQRRAQRIRRITAEYGFDELWECLP